MTALSTFTAGMFFVVLLWGLWYIASGIPPAGLEKVKRGKKPLNENSLDIDLPPVAAYVQWQIIDMVNAFTFTHTGKSPELLAGHELNRVIQTLPDYISTGPSPFTAVTGILTHSPRTVQIVIDDVMPWTMLIREHVLPVTSKDEVLNGHA